MYLKPNPGLLLVVIGIRVQAGMIVRARAVNQSIKYVRYHKTSLAVLLGLFGIVSVADDVSGGDETGCFVGKGPFGPHAYHVPNHKAGKMSVGICKELHRS